MNPEPPDLERILDPESQCLTPDAQHDPDTDDEDTARWQQAARELPGLGALVGVVREVLEERKDGEESEQPHLR